jgi:glycosyltransferase involved in cell wall biosynthesis
MNPEYVLAAGMLWRLLRKRIKLWYTHGTVSRNLRWAEKIVHTIYTASPESCQLASRKIIVTGHGIDTQLFTPLALQHDIDLITVGRITPSKNIEALIDVVAQVRVEYKVTLTIVGVAVSPQEKAYETKLKALIEKRDLSPVVHFYGACNQDELPTLLNRAAVFVSAAQNGSLDKVFLEALACGVPVITSAPGAVSLPLGDCFVASTEVFAEQIQKVVQCPALVDTSALREYVVQHHSLQNLVTNHLRI